MKEIDFEVHEAKRLMGQKVHHVGFNLANSLEWRSAISFVSKEIEVHVDLLVQLNERLEAP